MRLRTMAVISMCGAMLPAVVAAQGAEAAKSATPPTAAQAAPSDYALWENVIKIDRYGPRDSQPAATERRVNKLCLRPQDRTAQALMKQQDVLSRLQGGCWVTQDRQEENRTQVKWACKDGTTAEVATRHPAPNRIGYMVVFNIPNEGAISIQAEAIKIADVCEPGTLPPLPVTPAPPSKPSK